MDIREYDKRMYKLDFSGYCGVLMEEDVMKKIVSIQNNYITEIKKVLNENKEKLAPYDWTLTNTFKEDGKTIDKQLVIDFINECQDREAQLQNRINTFKVLQPRYVPHLYLAKDYFDAKQIAEYLIREDANE